MVVVGFYVFWRKMIHEGECVSVMVRKSAVAASDGSIKEPPSSQSHP